MAELAPSLLADDFYNLEKQLKILEEEKIKYLHLDIMDGHYVPNISYGPGVVGKLRDRTDFIFDVHLMVEKPADYIEEFKKAGADYFTFHIESADHSHRVIQKIHEAGMKAGISLNPGTSLDPIKYLLPDLDLILIMTVNPGFGGQKYIETMNQKIIDVRKMIDESGYDILLEVDGGVKLDRLEDLKEKGVDLIVSGSDIFNENICRQIADYKKILD